MASSRSSAAGSRSSAGTSRIHSRKTADMPYTSLEDTQKVATATLREAMANERCKRWTQVVRGYRRLLRMLEPENLPPDFVAPPYMSMLMYEIYYHLGLALQWAGEYIKAVQQYTKALEAVFIPKNGCLAGCNSNSCLMTPLYARRAFANAQAGDLKGALKDAEKSVVLDSKNPDVYCIRALVRMTRKEETAALQDAEKALKYNPNNLCALILRGGLVQPLVIDDWDPSSKKATSKDYTKACSINPACHNYLSVDSFGHPDILPFYERFLYSLSVPHTISTILLATGQPVSKAGSRSCTPLSTASSRLTVSVSPSLVNNNPMKIMQRHLWVNDRKKPFRCGTPKEFDHAREAQRRRKNYGQAVREHTSKPESIEDYIASIEKHRVRRAYELGNNRPQTASTTHAQSLGSSGQSRRTSSSQSLHRIKAFQTVNVKDAPRMYYRPWLGDKLPVAEVDRKNWLEPPFKV